MAKPLRIEFAGAFMGLKIKHDGGLRAKITKIRNKIGLSNV